MIQFPCTQSPLSRLVLFMVCLAIAGSFVAVVHHIAIDPPQQNAVLPPQNSQSECETTIQTMIYAKGLARQSALAALQQCLNTGGDCSSFQTMVDTIQAEIVQLHQSCRS
jgi:hypothetical protein